VEAKNHKGAHLLNKMLDVCSNQRAIHEMGAQILNGGAGNHWSPQVTALHKHRHVFGKISTHDQLSAL